MTQTSDRIDSKGPYTVTKSLVSATLDTGTGYAGLKIFCHHMDLPIMQESTYIKHSKSIWQATNEMFKTCVSNAVHIVKRDHTVEGLEPDETDPLHIAVSFDG